MEEMDSLIQRAQHLACLRRPPLDFTGAIRADIIEMIKEEIIELMKGGTILPSCQICEKISFFQPLAHERSFTYNRFEDAVLALAGKPSSRILASLTQQAKGSFPRFEDVFVVPPNMIMFDISPIELRPAEREVVRCKLCPLLWPVDSVAGEYLAAHRTWDGARQFGFCEMTDVKNDNGLRIGGTFSFCPTAFGKQEFLAIVGDVHSAAGEILARPMNLFPGSKQSHSMAQNWLKTCLESHTQCAKPRGDFMPTRLLEIKHFHDQIYPRLKLRETFGRDFAPYAALSYCWGGEQPITTTSQNINQHLIRINYTGLPKTIQDAITVASKLGLRYLWVDSLCIIQNDRQDRTFEIGQMPSIYSHARATISASRASSVQEGFLQSRRPLNQNSPYPILEFPYCCQDGEKGSVRLVPEVKEESMEPLSKRGWALQERLLSSRVIEFGSLQTRWVCMHEDGTQTDGLRLGVENESGRSDIIFRKALDAISFWGSSFSDASGISGLQRWKSILKRYTKLTLTLPTDRLPAISGVAMGFSRILADEYCAGLWKSALVTELFWILDVDEKPFLQRPREYQGPSWSWAGIDDPITFLHQDPSDLVDPQFSVLNVDIQPVKSDLDQYDAKFGAVESGKLVLTGKLKAARWMHPHDPSNLSQWKVLRRLDDKDSDPYLRINVRPDAIEAEFSTADADHIPVFLLKIIERRRQPDILNQSRPPMGLLLRRNNESEYTRLGVFEFLLMRKESIYDFKAEFDRYQEQVAWLNDCETQTITIV